MAVDTQDKRASVLGFGLAFTLVLPAPGTIDQPDRQHVAYSYRGIEAEQPSLLPDNIIIGSLTAAQPVRSLSVTHAERSIACDQPLRSLTFDG